MFVWKGNPVHTRVLILVVILAVNQLNLGKNSTVTSYSSREVLAYLVLMI